MIKRTPPSPTSQAVTTVLLADEDEGSREATAEALRDYGYHVVEVEDGLELADYLEELEEGHLAFPDVVVSAVALPGSSGLEVLEKLRSHPGQSASFIFLSARGDWTTFEAADRLGAEFVFEKPYDAEALREAIYVVAA
jgi:CheY-like chemotaxis protein